MADTALHRPWPKAEELLAGTENGGLAQGQFKMGKKTLFLGQSSVEVLGSATHTHPILF